LFVKPIIGFPLFSAARAAGLYDQRRMISRSLNDQFRTARHESQQQACNGS